MIVQKLKNSLKISTEQDFNHETAEATQQQLLNILDNNEKKEVVLLWAETDPLDEYGIRLLLGLESECQQRNIKFSAQIKNPAALKTIRLFGLDQRFTAKES